ncbi:MAG TPA: cysteine--tRNA ligase [Candidatus Krumholzibacteria bacterium]|nr:cysteine--tRNA ligase [Candidatus Krumholzibacteria bacterium]HPD72037.1 cysteine--tRNA ligase [Candidatus Krumholzibacteria bacterium]HRY41030.1 cysteine--tRNA ligase [Candidatus Krumholzibacteria bacterium]
MSLRVYDHLTRTKRPFAPVRPGRVGMYVCGLTVQDQPHLGHMYAFVACDMVRRYLEHLGYEVTHVQNFTDIDDKIIERARREGSTVAAVAERNMTAYHEAAAALRIEPAHHYPRVTEHVPDIVRFVGRLLEKGFAYAAGGDVYFRVRSWTGYGQLSGRDVDAMRSGVRIAIGDHKEDPLDFALWKAAPDHEPGWPSPWGRGRPGWHIECSAMAARYLGDHFDFHGGGRDLLFPHHENELAQSRCATGQPFVNHWLHNGLLCLGKSKMSKSDGNFLSMDELLRSHPAAVLRFFLLNAHFRSQLDFSEERLREATAGFDRLQRGARRLLAVLAAIDAGRDRPLPAGLASAAGGALAEAAASRRRRFFAAMDDDFNSGAAIGELFGLVRDLNQYLAETGGRGLDAGPLGAVRDLLVEADGILGIFPQGLGGLTETRSPAPEAVAALCEAREQARARRDWAGADSLRAQIREIGWEVIDTPGGPRLSPRPPAP